MKDPRIGHFSKDKLLVDLGFPFWHWPLWVDRLGNHPYRPLVGFLKPVALPFPPPWASHDHPSQTGSKRSPHLSCGFWELGAGGQWGSQDDGESVKALHRALDLGVNLIDTAAGYGDGHSERIIARALKERSDKPFLATKTPPLPGSWPPSPWCQARDRYPKAI